MFEVIGLPFWVVCHSNKYVELKYWELWKSLGLYSLKDHCIHLLRLLALVGERAYRKSSAMAKENISRMKREPTVWENVFANDTSDKGLISKIYK